MENGKLFQTEKAFVFMFSNCHFKLHFQIIMLLKTLFLEIRLKLLNEAITSNIATTATTSAASFSAIKAYLKGKEHLHKNLDAQLKQIVSLYYNQSADVDILRFTPVPEHHITIQLKGANGLSKDNHQGGRSGDLDTEIRNL